MAQGQQIASLGCRASDLPGFYSVMTLPAEGDEVAKTVGLAPVIVLHKGHDVMDV